MNTLVNVILAVIIVVWLGYILYGYVMAHKAAKFVEEKEFEGLIKTGQLVDLREPDAFKKSHIMGARNISFQILSQSINALRQDKKVLLYDSTTTLSKRAAILLHKKGYTNIYILKGGFMSWQGKKATKN